MDTFENSFSGLLEEEDEEEKRLVASLTFADFFTLSMIMF